MKCSNSSCSNELSRDNAKMSCGGELYCSDCITPFTKCVACGYALNKMQDYECVCGAHVCEHCAYGGEHMCEQAKKIWSGVGLGEGT